MSSYLVALVVGDYQHVTVDVPASDLRDYVLPFYIYYGYDINTTEATFALDTASAILPYYEQLFGISFPLPKMACIALSDFAAGAMENWGLVTYRKTALLADPNLSSESSLERVVVVIAHEFAHQWFGDIVTMKWWNDLWLNEGFASFVEFIGTNYTNPEFNYWDSFLIGITSAMEMDNSIFTHPINVEVDNPNEIDSIFDTITYVFFVVSFFTASCVFVLKKRKKNCFFLLLWCKDNACRWCLCLVSCFVLAFFLLICICLACLLALFY